MKKKIIAAIVTAILAILSAYGLYGCTASFMVSKGNMNSDQRNDQRAKGSIDSTKVSINNKN